MVGSGFMGRTHVMGYATALRAFDLPFALVLDRLADVTVEKARSAAKAFGFARASGDWREIIADPEIDLVDIVAPNALHKPIALAALSAGKHVYCEKPLAPSASDAFALSEAAASVYSAGVRTQVGYNYLCNPMFTLAREMISGGELGRIYSFRGIHAEDYMSDPKAPFSFRHESDGGGVLSDLGSHVLASAESLIGPLSEVLGSCSTLIKARPTPDGGSRAVDVDDVTDVLLRFSCGARGTLSAHWCASGQKMHHGFEIYGEKGALLFSQARLNELWYYDAKSGPSSRRGFRRIEASPDHVPYGRFCVAPGHQLGFNDLKAIEIARFIEAIAGLREEPYSFAKGARIQFLVDSIRASSKTASWVGVEADRSEAN